MVSEKKEMSRQSPDSKEDDHLIQCRRRIGSAQVNLNNLANLVSPDRQKLIDSVQPSVIYFFFKENTSLNLNFRVLIILLQFKE